MIVAGVYLTSAVQSGRKRVERRREKDKTAAVAASFLLCSLACAEIQKTPVKTPSKAQDTSRSAASVLDHKLKCFPCPISSFAHNVLCSCSVPNAIIVRVHIPMPQFLSYTSPVSIIVMLSCLCLSSMTLKPCIQASIE